MPAAGREGDILLGDGLWLWGSSLRQATWLWGLGLGLGVGQELQSGEAPLW